MATTFVGNNRTSGTGSWSGFGGTGGIRQIGVKDRIFVSDVAVLVTHLGGFLRKQNNTPKVEFAIWKNEGGVPGQLLARTGVISVGNQTTGDDYQGAIVWSFDGAQFGVNNAAFRLPAGVEFFIGAQADGGAMEVALETSQAVVQVYRKNTGQPASPTDPFGSASTTNINVPSFWMFGTIDTAPTVTLTGPAASISTAAPTITGNFSDAEAAAPTYDRIKNYQLEVWDPATQIVYWSSNWIPLANRNDFSFSKVYEGSALGNGTYEVRARAQDDSGFIGDWSDWHSFTITNLGAVDVSASTPIGKDEDGVMGPFTARWTHPLGTPMNAAWIRILSNGEVQRQTPAIVSKSAANNVVFSLSTAEANVANASGVRGPLPPGQYTWQVQGRDTAGAFSPWSADVAFSVNSPPNQPSGLNPISGEVLTERPRLEAFVSDPDLDDAAGVGVRAEFEITRPDASQVVWWTLNLDPSTGMMYWDVSETDAPVNGTYTWRVRGYDISASLPGPWSAPAIFTIESAPKVTVTAPLQNSTVITSTPAILWDVVDGPMTAYQVQFYRDGADTPFFSTGRVATLSATSGMFVIKPGWLSNNLFYQSDVTIWTAGNTKGVSTRRRFKVAFTAADALNSIEATLIQYDQDVEPTSVLVSWERTAYPSSQFEGYEIKRRTAEQDPLEASRVALIKQVGQLSWTDHHALPNESLVYMVSQLRRSTNGDVVASDPVEAFVDLVLTTPVIASVLNGAQYRASVKYLSTNLSESFVREDAMEKTWGTQGKPTWIRPPEGYGQEVYSVSWILKADDRADLKEHYRRVKTMIKSGHPVSLRTEMNRIFCKLTAGSGWAKRGRLGEIVITLTAEEIAWAEDTVFGG